MGLISIITALDGWYDDKDAEPPTHRAPAFIYYLKRPADTQSVGQKGPKPATLTLGQAP